MIEGDATYVAVFREAPVRQFEVGGIIYETSDGSGVAAVIGYVEGASRVPSTVEYMGHLLRVGSVRDGALLKCTELEFADLTNVSSVGFKAFGRCTGISEIVFGDSMDSVGSYAFFGLEFRGYDGSVLGHTPENLAGHAFLRSGESLVMAYTVTVSSDNPEVCTVSGPGYCLPGREVAVFAVPAGGYVFAGWYGGEELVSSEAEYRFEVSADVCLEAHVQKAAADAEFVDSGLRYRIVSTDPASVSLIGYEGSPMCVSLPSAVSFGGMDYNVTSVGEKAFYGCKTIASLDLGLVKTVGLKAFANCSNLKTLAVPETLTLIKGYAFYGCGITSLDIPGDDVVLEASAFSACKSMTDITFSGSGAVIGSNAFYKNNGVASVDLSTVASVGMKAFPYCYGLTSLTIPSNLEVVKEYAFYKCVNLKDLTVESGVKKIGASAFSGCTALERVELPSSLVYIGPNAFHGLSFADLDGKAMETSLKLRGHTFLGDHGSLRMVGDLADGDIITVDGVKYEVTSVHDRTVSAVGHEGEVASVPSSVTYMGWALSVESIGEKAFYNCVTLVALDLSNVTSIGFKAFGNCTGIEDIMFGDTLETIGGYALYGLSFRDGHSEALATSVDNLRGHEFHGSGGSLRMVGELQDGDEFDIGGMTYRVTSRLLCEASLVGSSVSPTRVAVPVYIECGGFRYSVTSVGEKAFYACPTLTTVNLGSVESVGEKAFMNCPNLKAVNLSGVRHIGFKAFANAASVKSLTIPATVEEIGGYAFYGLTSLTSLTISTGTALIGGGAFSGCTLLNSFSGTHPGIVDGVMLVAGTSLVSCAAGPEATHAFVPDSVTAIADGAFSRCLNLRSIELPGTVVSMGMYAIYGCASLEHLVLSPSLASVHKSAIQGTVLYDADGETVLPCRASALAGGCFEKMDGRLVKMTQLDEGDSFSLSSLTYTAIGSGEVSLTGYEGVITSLTVPSSVYYGEALFSVVSIGERAFFECGTLTSIDLSGIERIGLKAFAKCSGVTDIVFGDFLTTVGMYDFYGLSFYDGDEKLTVSPNSLRGHSFSGTDGKLYLIS